MGFMPLIVPLMLEVDAFALTTRQRRLLAVRCKSSSFVMLSAPALNPEDCSSNEEGVEQTDLASRKHSKLDTQEDNSRVGFLRFTKMAALKLFAPLIYVHRILFQAAASYVASFLAAVISDPTVSKALSQIVTEGMNSFLTQRKVKSKIFTFQQTMSNSAPSMSIAKQTGNDFLRIFTQFLAGLFSPSRPRYDLDMLLDEIEQRGNGNDTTDKLISEKKPTSE